MRSLRQNCSCAIHVMCDLRAWNCGHDDGTWQYGDEVVLVARVLIPLIALLDDGYFEDGIADICDDS